jgi:hypothetical protein
VKVEEKKFLIIYYDIVIIVWGPFNMNKIDHYLPVWHFAKKNKRIIDVQTYPPISDFYDVDFRKSMVIRSLFFLRGIRTKQSSPFSNLRNIIDFGFVLLEEDEREIVLGFVGKPWKWKGDIVPLSRKEFIHFHQPNYVQAVWNFAVEKTSVGEMVLTTETRIYCTSARAKRKFCMYWMLIHVFSGVIRNEMLRIINKEIVNKEREGKRSKKQNKDRK